MSIQIISFCFKPLSYVPRWPLKLPFRRATVLHKQLPSFQQYIPNETRSLRTSPQDTHLRTLQHVTIQHRYAYQGDIDQSFDFRSVRHANLQIWYIPLSQNSSAASRWNFDNHLSNMLLTDEMFICFLGLVEWENLVDDGPDLSSFEKPVHLFESWRAC